MQRKRYSITQIINILREGENGLRIVDLVKRYGISEQTYYRWKKKYGGMSISEAKRLKTLEEESNRLKVKVAELLLENDLLKEINSKKW